MILWLESNTSMCAHACWAAVNLNTYGNWCQRFTETICASMWPFGAHGHMTTDKTTWLRSTMFWCWRLGVRQTTNVQQTAGLIYLTHWVTHVKLAESNIQQSLTVRQIWNHKRYRQTRYPKHALWRRMDTSGCDPSKYAAPAVMWCFTIKWVSSPYECPNFMQAPL